MPIKPKFRIRKCGIAKTAVIQSIGSMDWKHLLSGITLIKSLVRYMRNFYWLIRVYCRCCYWQTSNYSFLSQISSWNLLNFIFLQFRAGKHKQSHKK